MNVYIVRCDNGVVTDKYLDIISEAHKKIGYCSINVGTVIKCKKNNKKDVIVISRLVDGFKAIIKGWKNIVFWFQGVEPEESYMNHHSIFRKWILSYIERVMLKRSKVLIFVSEYMKTYLEKKHNISIKSYYCMPCLNTSINKDSFDFPGKYLKETFVYAGSMAKWQSFDSIVKYYKKIEDCTPEACLKVFTAEKEIAQRILASFEVKNYEILYFTGKDLEEQLSMCKYGFILRDDNIVNNVATPTKISTYLSCGLIPIYSSSLKDFSAIAEKMYYVFSPDIESIDNLKKKFSIVSKTSIFDEYNSIFQSYYNEERHKLLMANVLRKSLINE